MLVESDDLARKKKKERIEINGISKYFACLETSENWPIFFFSIVTSRIYLHGRCSNFIFKFNLEKSDSIRIFHNFCVIAFRSFLMLPVSSWIRITAIFSFQRHCGRDTDKTRRRRLKLLNYPIVAGQVFRFEKFRFVSINSFELNLKNSRKCFDLFYIYNVT